MPDFVIAQGDREPSISDILTDQDDTPKNLTAGSIVFRRRLRPGGVKVENAAIIVGDPTLGQVQYDWAPGDTDTPGVYDYQWVVTIAGKESTFPSNNYEQFEIYEDIQDPPP